jgi:predicted PurR-regulated permease PerM
MPEFQFQPGMRPNKSAHLLENASRFAIIGLGLIAFVIALDATEFLVAPIFIAVVIGLMFGPVADRLERFGLPATLSGACIVLLFLLLIAVILLGVAIPLSQWLDNLPQIWARVQAEAAKWQGLLQSFEQASERVRELFSSDASLTVSVDDGSTVTDAAFVAPGVLAQIATFLISMYFFIATRHEIRRLALRLCLTRRLRWRMARVFRDIELRISRYLLSITAINVGLGVAVGMAMWIIGMPSPLFWGLMAALTNYVVYVGPAVMVALVALVAISTGDGLSAGLLPVGAYLVLSFIESQFVSPHVMGRAMHLNPFFVFLALAFWIWLWGPVGGFVALPAVLISQTLIQHMFFDPRQPPVRTVSRPPIAPADRPYASEQIPV